MRLYFLLDISQLIIIIVSGGHRERGTDPVSVLTFSVHRVVGVID